MSIEEKWSISVEGGNSTGGAPKISRTLLSGVKKAEH